MRSGLEILHTLTQHMLILRHCLDTPVALLHSKDRVCALPVSQQLPSKRRVLPLYLPQNSFWALMHAHRVNCLTPPLCFYYKALCYPYCRVITSAQLLFQYSSTITSVTLAFPVWSLTSICILIKGNML